MKIKQERPDLYIYTPDRRETKGIVVQPQEFSVDYNFNAASQMSFKVNKFIYDEHNECWVKNPSYEYLKENMLIATTDYSSKYKFKGLAEAEYSLGTQLLNRYSLSYQTTLKNATLQPETMLFDIGNHSGYIWKYRCIIDDKGAFCDYSAYKSSYDKIACETFFPVEVGDILSLGCMYDSNNNMSTSDDDGEPHFSYQIFYYSEANSSSFTKKTDSYVLYDPMERIRIEEGDFGSGITKGYIRLSARSHKATYNENVNGRKWYSYSPGAGYVRLYSGERRCSRVTGVNVQTAYLTDRWWIIDSVEENKDFINSSKTINLYSYEYVLSKKSFSISEATLPLFIPESIVETVHDNEFIYGYHSLPFPDGEKHKKGSQRMHRGLINQILDYLPDWKIGLFSPTIVTRYRTVEEVDNGNIYSFLLNTVQALYHCYILFDTENKTINLISKDAIFNLKSNSILTWDNALKSMKITNSDTKYVTAMRIHTAEDQYGIGLVNPTGNNIIYNFTSVKDNLDFIADPTHYKDDTGTSVYTLKEVVDLYEKSITNTISGSQKWGDTDSYRTAAENLINITKKHIELSTKLAELLAEYKSTSDTINIYLQDKYQETTLSNYLISDNPRTPDSMENSGIYAPHNDYGNYHSQALYNKLYSIAKAYYGCRSELEVVMTRKNDIQNHLKHVALMYSLNYRTLKIEYDKCQKNGTPYYPIFTPQEALALSYYIYEADWTDDNAIFSEKYLASDIMNTLIDTYNDAKKELDNIYSKQTYEFSLESSNIFSIPEMQFATENMYLGNSLYIINKGEWIQPILLSVHINYDDKTDFSMTFSTDYKRKPLELRFSDLFGTINQVSTEIPAFTFDK